jgi:KDO2-lipid IV(A) lauroyltransferase
MVERQFGAAFGLRGNALRSLVRLNFSRFAESLADHFSSVARPKEWSDRLVATREGSAHLQEAKAAGRGALIVTAHFGSWELGGTILANQGIPLTVVTLQEPSAELNRWRESRRNLHGIRTLTIGADQFAILEIVRALGRGEFVAMLVDRPVGGDGVPVPFFGRPTPFSGAPAMIWRHTGAPILPAAIIRQPGGRYLSLIGAPLAFEDGGERQEATVANTARVAAFFEGLIRAHPEQWFNYAPLWGEEEAAGGQKKPKNLLHPPPSATRYDGQ